MKKSTATALALLITGCAQQTFTVQNKLAAVAPKETITHHFFVSGPGRRNWSMQPKFVAVQKNVVKTETQQTFVNGLPGFITLGIYTPLKRVCIARQLHELPIDTGQSYLHCSLTYWVPSSCFCTVISLF